MFKRAVLITMADIKYLNKIIVMADQHTKNQMYNSRKNTESL
ncbi:hypothetical protein PTUN_b0586 [Pseudoalteromonas tunicata]|nr:hypothetical protein PTUN_b0586 [Pseudoalteromonas tunicata]